MQSQRLEIWEELKKHDEKCGEKLMRMGQSGLMKTGLSLLNHVFHFFEQRIE